MSIADVLPEPPQEVRDDEFQWVLQFDDELANPRLRHVFHYQGPVDEHPTAFIPGMLQAEAYTRWNMNRYYRAPVPEAVAAFAVDCRQRRLGLALGHQAAVDVVLHESAATDPYYAENTVGRQVLAQALRHVVEVVGQRQQLDSRLTLRVIRQEAIDTAQADGVLGGLQEFFAMAYASRNGRHRLRRVWLQDTAEIATPGSPAYNSSRLWQRQLAQVALSGPESLAFLSNAADELAP